MDEKDLVSRFLSGDRGAFELLVRLHHRSVYSMAFRYMKDHAGADEVTQDTFVKAFHAAGSFRGESSFKSWLLRIAINTAKNALRSSGRRQMVDVEDVVLKSEHSGFQRLEAGQTADVLRQVVERLPEKQRQALELRIFEDLSFKEIAEIMESPFDTAKANFRHALMNMRKILENHEGGQWMEEMKLAFEQLGDRNEEVYDA